MAQAEGLAPTRDFTAALRTGELTCIAEIKRRSPSKGDLCPDLQPELVAKEYVAGGAACLSVLTDVDHFGGSVADLQQARQASGALSGAAQGLHGPGGRIDVCDARLMGADAVLLIVAALSDDRAEPVCSRPVLRQAWAWLPLVEVHDEPELDRALAAGATLVGVNQRDLRTFEVDHSRAQALRAAAASPPPWSGWPNRASARPTMPGA